MDLIDYKKYTTEDFVLDENFRKIIKGKFGQDAFIKKFPEKAEEIELAIKILGELTSDKYLHSPEQKRDLWKQLIWSQRKQMRLQLLRYAASGLLLLGIGGTSFFYLNSDNSLKEFAALNKVSYKDNAALILNDGKKIDISSRESKVKYTNDGKGVLVNDTTKTAQNDSEDGFNQMIVPFGKRSTITLSDDTKVWLNSGSRLVYAPSFKEKTREVYLEGEGYFEVAKDAQKAFYVHTKELKIKVYGTKFDVQAYDIDNGSNIILVEGKVSVDLKNKFLSKEIFMDPNHKAFLSKEGGEIKVTQVDNIEKYIGWLDGYMTFDNEDLHFLIKRIEKYYNIKIETRLKENYVKISGKLDLKDDPEKVLASLAIISKTRYVKQGDEFLFYE